MLDISIIYDRNVGKNNVIYIYFVIIIWLPPAGIKTHCVKAVNQ